MRVVPSTPVCMEQVFSHSGLPRQLISESRRNFWCPDDFRFHCFEHIIFHISGTDCFSGHHGTYFVPETYYVSQAAEPALYRDVQDADGF